jgi:hypothetical protein
MEGAEGGAEAYESYLIDSYKQYQQMLRASQAK